ncbi:MAG: hypothetical protein NVSMB62_08790 [Acidobacteriaceae bacterium]
MNVGAPGSEDRKKFIAICAFAVLAAGVLYYELYTPGTPTTTAPAPVVTTVPGNSSAVPAAARSAISNSGLTAKTVGTTAAALDPTLHMEPMRRAEAISYQGTGRNIFSGISAPTVAIPRPFAPARPGIAQNLPPAPPPGPPPPPPIDLKFSGYFAAGDGSGEHQVILVHGDDVVLAHAGDIVLRRYRIVSVSANSIQVEDMSNNNKQLIPLSN